MRYQFCPNCGTKYKDQDHLSFLKCDECAFVFYQNSKPTVTGMIEKDGKLLLAKRGIEPHKGKWDLPGGFLEFSEDPKTGVIREMKEETGLDVDPGEIMTIEMDTYSNTNDSTLNIFYICKVLGGDMKAEDDVAELEWFSPDDIPDNFGFESAAKVAKQWAQNKKQA